MNTRSLACSDVLKAARRPRCRNTWDLAASPEVEKSPHFLRPRHVISPAVSLGQDQSLIVYVGSDDERAHRNPEPMQRWGHLRLSIGLEDVDDLVRDLAGAMADVRTAD